MKIIDNVHNSDKRFDDEKKAECLLFLISGSFQVGVVGWVYHREEEAEE